MKQVVAITHCYTNTLSHIIYVFVNAETKTKTVLAIFNDESLAESKPMINDILNYVLVGYESSIYDVPLLKKLLSSDNYESVKEHIGKSYVTHTNDVVQVDLKCLHRERNESFQHMLDDVRFVDVTAIDYDFIKQNKVIVLEQLLAKCYAIVNFFNDNKNVIKARAKWFKGKARNPLTDNDYQVGRTIVNNLIRHSKTKPHQPQPLPHIARLIDERIPDLFIKGGAMHEDVLPYIANIAPISGNIMPTINVCDRSLKMSLGGVHSVNDAGIYDNVYHIDVNGFYPNVIRAFDIKPSSFVDDSYQQMIKDLLKQQANAHNLAEYKQSKASLVYLYGALGYEKSGNLHDRIALLKTAIHGQLIMLAILETIEMLIDDIKLISVNTDGLFVSCSEKSKEEIIKAITHDVLDKFAMKIEVKMFDKILINGNNNYALIKDGHIVSGVGNFKESKTLNRLCLESFIKEGSTASQTIDAIDSVYPFYQLLKTTKANKYYLCSGHNKAQIKTANACCVGYGEHDYFIKNFGNNINTNERNVRYSTHIDNVNLVNKEYYKIKTEKLLCF